MDMQRFIEYTCEDRLENVQHAFRWKARSKFDLKLCPKSAVSCIAHRDGQHRQFTAWLSSLCNCRAACKGYPAAKNYQTLFRSDRIHSDAVSQLLREHSADGTPAGRGAAWTQRSATGGNPRRRLQHCRRVGSIAAAYVAYRSTTGRASANVHV